MSLNMVQLIGNLGRDPEIRSTNNGTRIASFSIATSERWRDRDSGEQKERTDWHNIVVFGNRSSDGLVRVVEEYLHKGSKVYVQGELRTRKWQDNGGQDRYTTEVVLQGFNCRLEMLDGKNGGGNRPPDAEEHDYAPTSGGGYARRRDPPPRGQADIDDEIPFVTNDLAYEPYLWKTHCVV